MVIRVLYSIVRELSLQVFLQWDCHSTNIIFSLTFHQFWHVGKILDNTCLYLEFSQALESLLYGHLSLKPENKY